MALALYFQGGKAMLLWIPKYVARAALGNALYEALTKRVEKEGARKVRRLWVHKMLLRRMVGHDADDVDGFSLTCLWL